MPDSHPTSELRNAAGHNSSKSPSPAGAGNSVFRFKQFCVSNEFSALKVGTDAVLLGALASLPDGCSRVLDIGTGTGVIALMLAQRLAANRSKSRPHNSAGNTMEEQPRIATGSKPGGQPQCSAGKDFRITGIDIDGPSAREAAANFAASPWADSLEALECPLAEYGKTGQKYPQAGASGESQECPLAEYDKTATGRQIKEYSDETVEKFDLIVSNPPFFDDSLQNPDPRESAARHSVSLTLSEICAFAAEHLAEGGHLALIVPAESAASLRRTAASFSLAAHRFVNIRTTERKPVRRVVAQFVLSRTPLSCTEQTLLLCDSATPDGRTEEYRALVEPFLIR